MMRFLPVLFLAAALAGIASAQGAPPESSQHSSPATPSPEEQAIRKVIDDQVTAWNRGDLEGYLAGYWRSPEVTFFSGASETRGWQPTLDRYGRSYQAKGHAMGMLAMSEVRIDMLGPEAALVRALWSLKLPDGSTPHGLTTLIFRKLPEGWRIVHDHSSGA